MTDDFRENRLGGGDFRAAYSPAAYTGAREGAGRWFRLYGPDGDLGIIWTNDSDAVGFLPVTVEENPSVVGVTPLIAEGLSTGAAAGAPPTVVFDRWSQIVTQGFSVGPVEETTDLASLNA